MINLEEIFDGAILNTLRERYYNNQIYTNISSILLAVNPYKSLDIYNESYMSKYDNSNGDDTNLKPHPYQIASSAYYNMIKTKLIQSIIISGESGAGKTETTKILLRFLSYKSSRLQTSPIEQQILDTNPLIESFGNAQTIRNHNSSRFGKWIEIQYNANYQIIGANIEHFLLEQSRIFFTRYQ